MRCISPPCPEVRPGQKRRAAERRGSDSQIAIEPKVGGGEGAAGSGIGGAKEGQNPRKRNKRTSVDRKGVGGGSWSKHWPRLGIETVVAAKDKGIGRGVYGWCQTGPPPLLGRHLRSVSFISSVLSLSFVMEYRTDMGSQRSSVTKTFLDAFVVRYWIPLELCPVVPPTSSSVQDVHAGMVAIYTSFFSFSNFRIPVSRFLCGILQYYNVHLTQLVPLSRQHRLFSETRNRYWRKLLVALWLPVMRSKPWYVKNPSRDSCPEAQDAEVNHSDHFVPDWKLTNGVVLETPNLCREFMMGVRPPVEESRNASLSHRRLSNEGCTTGVSKPCSNIWRHPWDIVPNSHTAMSLDETTTPIENEMLVQGFDTCVCQTPLAVQMVVTTRARQN
ncbi:hypothetical protein E3N88_40429 [Mikania micrantha]|uniref:Uncharacterized protein n=1 Tax=Mikania micrantha TaxID=192012 RepID=A0A5N6LMJ9_9ASTR|nr:hypothetical protein E3N88_40429 [Mikania micrantha]